MNTHTQAHRQFLTSCTKLAQAVELKWEIIKTTACPNLASAKQVSIRLPLCHRCFKSQVFIWYRKQTYSAPCLSNLHSLDHERNLHFLYRHGKSWEMEVRLTKCVASQFTWQWKYNCHWFEYDKWIYVDRYMQAEFNMLLNVINF